MRYRTERFTIRQALTRKDLTIPVEERVVSTETALIFRQSYEGTHYFGLTSGTYDLLHPGHLKYIEELSRITALRARACRLTPVVAVAINSDQSTQRNKGDRTNNRPVFDAYTRACLIAGLKGVDFTFIFDDDQQLAMFNPHLLQIFAQSDNKPSDRPEVAFLRSQGVEINEVIEKQRPTSTTEILARIHDLQIR